MNKEERRALVQEMLAEIDFDSYDYTAAPGADMRFPDFTEAEMEDKQPWIAKHFNETSEWRTVHVPDLNQIADGSERRLMAVYGIPVEWPSKEEDSDGFFALLDELDAARAEGGSAWDEAKDSHGLINDEHYDWVRGRKLWIPEQIGEDYGKAKAAIAEIDAAIARRQGHPVLSRFGFRDERHYQYVKTAINRLGAKAWSAYNAVLEQTNKQLDERFAQNKAALANELGPYNGMSMETWAAANARLSQGQPLEALLHELRMERPAWDDINAEWNARMSRDTTATIATVYGQAFMGAGQGQFGGAAQAMSASMQQGHGKGVQGAGDPISFEDWIKIQAHMSAAAGQGVDANAVLAQYKMNAGDWGAAGGYWAMKMSSSPMDYLEQYQTLSAKYAQAFATGAAGSDIEF